MESAISIISLVDICVKYGTLLVTVCESYKHGDAEIREIVLKIEAHWLKIQHQLKFLQGIWSSLDEDYQIHQNTVLQLLQSKVQVATSLVDSVIGQSSEEMSIQGVKSKRGESKRAKYALRIKGSLKIVLDDLKDWSEIFDFSWFLLIRQSDKSIDVELQPAPEEIDSPLLKLKDLREAIDSAVDGQTEAEQKTVFLGLDTFNTKTTALNHSSAEIWQSSDGRKEFFVDSLSDTSTIIDVCNLAKILRKVEPLRFGMLACCGVAKVPTDSSISAEPLRTRFVFPIPPQFVEPRFLRELIICGIESQPLNDRFSLAKELAKAVMFVHSTGFVHKNIRPETCLVLRDEKRTSHAFLTGFESFRTESGKTIHRGDNSWEKNLYRHPSRQGVRPETDYVMQHDIYSLGVCMLEIGLGTSFISYGSTSIPDSNTLAVPNTSDLPIKDQRKRAFALKRAFVEIAKSQLPSKMGHRYSETVVTCLTCLDNANNAFGDESEFLDANGLLVGIRYIEKILTALLDIRL